MGTIMKYYAMGIMLILISILIHKKFISIYLDETLTLPVILWWTPFTSLSGKEIKCLKGNCLVTQNRKNFISAKLKSVMFYGSTFNHQDLPSYRSLIDYWGLLHEESPKNNPLFCHESLLRMFNFTATFRHESDFPLTLLHLGHIEMLTDHTYFIPTKKKNEMLKTRAPIVYVQSSCDCPSQRDIFVLELIKHIEIDSFGLCLHNRDFPPGLESFTKMYDPKFLQLLASYKFILTIENSACPDYITEKLWRAFHVGSVPIYFGASNIKDWLPHPNSAILIKDFYCPKDLAEYIINVNNNDSLYESYLSYKHGHVTNENLLKAMRERLWDGLQDTGKGSFVHHFECFACDLLYSHLDEVLNKHLPFHHANHNHYGCPMPVSVLSMSVNYSSWWVEQWLLAEKQAVEVSRTIESTSFSN